MLLVQGGLVSILVQGTRSHMLQLKPSAAKLIQTFLKKEELLRLHLLRASRKSAGNPLSGLSLGAG